MSNDPEHNAVLALQAWVEKGTAPQDFIATKFQNDDPTQPVTMQRPLCPYPSQAVYKGTGDTNNASIFYCG
jgi:feruloyl esterase